VATWTATGSESSRVISRFRIALGSGGAVLGMMLLRHALGRL
jgi:hypothetical protein